MLLGALGDVHGAFADARRIVERHPEVPVLAVCRRHRSEAATYEPLGAPIYWIHGNNDNFDAIAAADLPAGLHHIANGTADRGRGGLALPVSVAHSRRRGSRPRLRRCRIR